jgi:hypothetical protein
MGQGKIGVTSNVIVGITSDDFNFNIIQAPSQA